MVAVAEVTMTHAERLYRHWGLRCCTLEQFSAWLYDAAGSNNARLITISRAAFCTEALAPWCQQQQHRGACIGRATSTRGGPRSCDPAVGGRAAEAWLRGYLSQPRTGGELARARSVLGFSESMVRRALRRIGAVGVQVGGRNEMRWSLSRQGVNFALDERQIL
jgi:hypothetical protein